MIRVLTERERLANESKKTKQNMEQNLRNEANIDYLAMMADIEIPTEEGEEDEPEI